MWEAGGSAAGGELKYHAVPGECRSAEGGAYRHLSAFAGP